MAWLLSAPKSEQRPYRSLVGSIRSRVELWSELPDKVRRSPRTHHLQFAVRPEGVWVFKERESGLRPVDLVFET